MAQLTFNCRRINSMSTSCRQSRSGTQARQGGHTPTSLDSMSWTMTGKHGRILPRLISTLSLLRRADGFIKTVDEIIPSLAHGRYIFHGGATQPADSTPVPPEQSQDDDDEQPFRPLSAVWTGPNPTMASPSLPTLSFPRCHPQPSQSTVAHDVPATVPATPASTLKGMPSDDVEARWSNKCTRTTGPESILALGRSVEGIRKVMAAVFAPQKSSAMSPTKKVEVAHAYIANDDTFLRVDTAPQPRGLPHHTLLRLLCAENQNSQSIGNYKSSRVPSPLSGSIAPELEAVKAQQSSPSSVHRLGVASSWPYTLQLHS
ncbi:hypothetical protein B0H10DRAFT_1965899 [Mycena sp. CBHHK59/15]|nr:hypothetical protein B0H10DRAFT_1965899 [Mycena sp. CBHHK59/15]